jgi:nitrogenase molybdenum-cofactor synthesis protein NifE
MCAPIPLHRQTGVPGKVPGALLVAKGIKRCIPLLHAPVGCAFQRKVNPFRPWDISFDVPCSKITEVETVYGGNDRLFNAIRAVAEKYKPDLILVISTCAPDLIGDDFEGVIKEVRNEISCEVVYTTGNAKRQAIGVQDALSSIIDQLVEEPSEKLEYGVNICTMPAHNATFKIAELKGLLEEIGAKINGVYFIDSTVDQIRKLSRAKLNITDTPQEWCRLAEKKFGMKSLALNQFQFDSWDESPGTVSGTVKLLNYIAKELELSESAYEAIEMKKQQVENELSVYKERLQGKRIAMSFFLHGGTGPIMIKEFGMECGVFIIKTPALSRSLKRKAMEEMIRRNMNFIKKYQDYEPVILFDPTPDEEITAIKQNNIDLAVYGLIGANLSLYLKNGIRIFDEGRFSRYYVRSGFEFVINLAKEVEKAFYKPIAQEPLLSLLNYSHKKESPHLTEYWANIADCFQSVWYCDACEECAGEDRR